MKIIVLTNSSGIYGLEPSLSSDLKGFAENGKDIAVFDNSGKLTLIDLSQNYLHVIQNITVILVNDHSEIEEVPQGISFVLNQLIGDDDLYIIYHDNPIVNYEVKHQRGLKRLFEKQIKSEIHSRQVTNSAHAKVFHVLANWNINDFKLLTLIFPDPVIDAILELLHQCLTPEGAASCIEENGKDRWKLIDRYSLLGNIEIGGILIAEYLKSFKGDCFDEDNYIKPLRILRDTLLTASKNKLI
jgi:hypothetical protein